MRAESDDAQLAVARLRAGGGLFKVDREGDGERRQERQHDATESEQGFPLHFACPPKILGTRHFQRADFGEGPMAEAKRRAPRIELMVLCYAMQRGVIC